MYACITAAVASASRDAQLHALVFTDVVVASAGQFQVVILIHSILSCFYHCISHLLCDQKHLLHNLGP